MEKKVSSVVNKFLDRIGATLIVELDRWGYDKFGKFVCIRVEVIYKKEINYLQFHCYNLKNNNIVYSDGNSVVGINEGILAYLGDSKELQNYFGELARTEAGYHFDL